MSTTEASITAAWVQLVEYAMEEAHVHGAVDKSLQRRRFPIVQREFAKLEAKGQTLHSRCARWQLAWDGHATYRESKKVRMGS